MEEFVELVLTETATAADVQEKLKLETLPIKNDIAFFFLVLSLLLLLLLRSKKAEHLAADEAKKGQKADGASCPPKPNMWCARCW